MILNMGKKHEAVIFNSKLYFLEYYFYTNFLCTITQWLEKNCFEIHKERLNFSESFNFSKSSFLAKGKILLARNFSKKINYKPKGK